MPAIAQKAPYRVAVESGRKYAWCACGMSKSQPFCDGSHKGGPHAPIVFTAQENGDVWLCGCKHTKGGPFCDGTHSTL